MTNGNHVAEIDLPSGRTSPRLIQFQNPLPNSHSHHSSMNGSPVTISDQPRVPQRTLSNTNLSYENKSLSIDHNLQECSDPNCAFGWETYVCDHNCRESEPEWSRIFIHTLLHDTEENPLLADHVEGVIRHVHLPANNMKWIEVSLPQKQKKK